MQRNFKVTGICRTTRTCEDFFKDSQIQLVEGNIRDKNNLVLGLKDASVVVVNLNFELLTFSQGGFYIADMHWNHGISYSTVERW